MGEIMNNIGYEIERLLKFALKKNMISKWDVIPTRNALIDLLKLESPFEGEVEEVSEEKIEKQEADNEPTVLKTTIWPQPFCFDKTPDEKKSEKTFEFSPEGLAQAVNWLNDRYISEKKRWTRD